MNAIGAGQGRRVLLAVALLCAFSLGVGSGPALGMTTDPHVLPDAVAILPDIDEYASMYGVDVATARAQMAEVDRVAAFEEEIRNLYPETFAGLWIEHDPYRVVVALTEPSDGSVIAAAEDSGFRAPVVERAVSRSLEYLSALQSAITATGVDATSAILVQENLIDLHVLTTADVDRLLAPVKDPTSVRVRVANALGGLSINMYGGLGGAAKNWSGCPSGFVVRNAQQAGGIITAGHCGNALSYQGYSLPYCCQRWEASSDVQFHTTPGFVSVPAFYFNASQFRYVYNTRSWSAVVIGQTLCKYGPAGGYACGEVETKTYRPSSEWIPNPASTFVRVKRCHVNLSFEGDSGGPVFSGNSAYGTVAGYEYDLNPFCWMDRMLWFPSINYQTAPLNLTVVLAQ